MERLFLKLGGSLITHKERPFEPRLEVLSRAAREIAQALKERPDVRLVLGHGSGSFGHAEAKRQGLDGGPSANWLGYLHVHWAAERLNRLVVEALKQADLPAAVFAPWPAVMLRRREVIDWPLAPLGRFLDEGGLPVIHGDVGREEDGGLSIVSTERLLVYLARYLPPREVILATRVAGLFTSDPLRNPQAQPVALLRASQDRPLEGIGGALEGDTTGGMRSKVEAMLDLVRQAPRATVHVISGADEGNLYQALLGRDVPGTRIVYA